MQIDLFNHQTDAVIKPLPKDGSIEYFPKIFDSIECNDLFQKLLNSVNWQPDELVMFGKKIITKRKVAWIGDSDCTYTYSGVKKQPQAWTSELLMLKTKAEELSQCKFNTCLLNLYHNGEEGMGWHSDDEPELDHKASIVSISFGATRKFSFKHKIDNTKHTLLLEHGSALVMRPPIQNFWSHSLLKTKLPIGPRINLTFRKIRAEYES